MPSFSKTEGIKIGKSEACDNCDLFPCQVFTDLTLEGSESKYDGVLILKPEQEIKGAGLDTPHMFCKSFKPYTPPSERPDPDPYFGKAISTNESNRWRGIPEDTPWNRPLPNKK